MSEHTPGPWKWEGENFGFQNNQGKLVRWFWIEHCLGPDAKEWAEVEANRRLIAAAPTMLEVLEEILQHSQLYSRINMLAKAAILRAKGK